MILSDDLTTIAILIEFLISDGKRNLKRFLLVRFDIMVVIGTGEKISSLIRKLQHSLIDLLGEWDKSVVLHTILYDNLPSHGISDTADQIMDYLIVEIFLQL